LSPLGEIAGSNGPKNAFAPGGRVSLTGVSKSASRLPWRSSLCSRTPVSAISVPLSACVTSE
jgi:hypothetical protein